MLLAACTRTGHDARLEEVYRLTSENPDSALKLLAGIDRSSLAPADRHYYDFVLLKGRDKAYITHKSDSLYLSVLKYAEQHKGEGWYPEALYYGGRVYSDIGDYPTALRYFHQALDLLPRDGSKQTLDMRANALSQTGRLLDRMRLHQEAIPVIKESLRYDSLLKDTISLIDDLHLLAVVYTRANNLLESERVLTKLSLINSRSEKDKALTKLYMAGIQYDRRNPRLASRTISGIWENLDSLDLQCAYTYAAKIYRDINMPDSAYYYATKIIDDPDKRYIHSGYDILFDEKLSSVVARDALLRYVRDYRNAIEKYYDENAMELAIAQRSLYNYKVHEIKRKEAESVNKKLRNIIYITILIVLGCAIIILFLYNRNNRIKKELQKSINSVVYLKELVNHDQENLENITGEQNQFESSLKELNAIEFLRDKILHQLKNISSIERKTIDAFIINSSVYLKIKDCLAKGKFIKDSDRLWGELETLINTESPLFLRNLTSLFGGRMSDIEIKTCLLIKCGFKVSEMAILLNRTASSISSRRVEMSKKLFGSNIGPQKLDLVIRELI